MLLIDCCRAQYQQKHAMPKFNGSTMHPLYLPDVVRRTAFQWQDITRGIEDGLFDAATVDYLRELYKWHRAHGKQWHDAWGPQFVAAIEAINKTTKERT